MLYLRRGVRGEDRPILDPNTLDAGGTVALDWHYPSQDGTLLAYGLSENGTEQSVLNEFTARTYRCVNFVADIPMRIDDVAAHGAAPAVAFVLTEIQLVDSETARANERGDSAHSLYKKRQRARVRTRLEDLHRGRAEPDPSALPLERDRDTDLPEDDF